MKSTRAMACTLLASMAASAAAAPVSWWRGDGDATDAVGSNHGTLLWGTYAPGVHGQAFAFDGSIGVVNVPDAPSLRLGSSLTIEATIKPLMYTGFLGGMILFRGDDRTGHDPYFMRLLPDGRLEFGIDNAQGTRAQLQSQLIPLDEFTYVVGALDGATGRMELRVNGVTVASTFTNVRPLLQLDPARNPGLAIGNHNRYPPFPYNIPFHGLIDQVRLHDAFLIPGDANYDGVVSLQDFNRLAGNFGTSGREWAQGDFNGDAAVTLADFNILAAHFGIAASIEGPTAADWSAL